MPASDGAPDDGGRDSRPEQADPEEAARQICLRMLTAGPRTRAQLATALRRRRIPDQAAQAVLGRLADVGLIDDAAFARAWVESRHHGRGLARRALSSELLRRGVAAEEVGAAVDSLQPEDEIATARRLVARRIAGTRGRPLPTRVRQLTGMLARKGYPASLAAQVVREALAEDGQADLEAGVDWDGLAEADAGDCAAG